jgi:hypothetical protein
MTTESTRFGIGAILGLAMLLGGCVAPPLQPPPQTIELNVTLQGAGACCQGARLVQCHERTADIKTAYVDPEALHHYVPTLDYSGFDLPGTGEHDLPGTIERDLAITIERDLAGTIERDLARTIEHDRGETIGHDLLRCKFRNQRLRSALEACHQKRNLCLSNNLDRAACNDDYQDCYIEAVQAGPFDAP